MFSVVILLDLNMFLLVRNKPVKRARNPLEVLLKNHQFPLHNECNFMSA